MNVYDFDKTICDGDTAANFYLFLLRRYPRLLWRLPKVLVAGALFSLKLISGVQVRNMFYPAFMPFIDVEFEASVFWEERSNKIRSWYLAQCRPDDVITTASPDCLMRPIVKKLGVRLIATKVNIKTGRVIGKDNRGTVKPLNFLCEYPDAVIDNFYSDSHSDDPMAALAKKAFLVHGDEIMPWS